MDTREELREAGEHAKQALAATLKAVRSALDMAIDRLDGDGAKEERPVADATRPGETPNVDDDRVR